LPCLSDRSIAELLPDLSRGLKAPWATLFYPAVASIGVVWYVLAMGIYDVTSVGVLVAGVLYGAVVIRELYRGREVASPDIVLDESQHIRVGSIPWGSNSYSGLRIHFFNRSDAPGRLLSYDGPNP